MNNSTNLTFSLIAVTMAFFSFLMKKFQVLSVLHLQDFSNENIGTYMCTAVFSNEKKSSGTFYLAQTSMYTCFICLSNLDFSPTCVFHVYLL